MQEKQTAKTKMVKERIHALHGSNTLAFLLIKVFITSIITIPFHS